MVFKKYILNLKLMTFLSVLLLSSVFFPSVASASQESQTKTLHGPFFEHSTPVIEDLRNVIYSTEKGLFVVVGDNGVIITSSDKENWTNQSTPTSENIYDVVYSKDHDLFVAIGANGVVLTSPDGENWTEQTTPLSNSIRSVTYSSDQNLFVTAGINSLIMTSPDGENWTEQTSPVSKEFFSVTYAENHDLFLIGGQTQAVLTSPDGENWTEQNSGFGNVWGLAYSPVQDLFIGVYSSGGVMTSSDGKNWTIQSTPVTNTFRDISYSPDQESFLAVGDNGTVATSTDGENWNEGYMTVSNDLLGAAYSSDGDLFVAVGQGGLFLSKFDFTSDDLEVNDFGFDLLLNYTIEGVEVEIEKEKDSSSDDVTDNQVSLMVNNQVQGDNKADTSSQWPTNRQKTTYGSGSDMWGFNLDSGDINDSNFGVFLSVDTDTPKIDVYSISVTVFYEPDSVEIQTCNELQDINQDLAAHYALTQDIDCSDTANWNHTDTNGDGTPDTYLGFEPIGGGSDPFEGVLNGQGYEIKDIYINRDDESQVALFSHIGSGGVVKNLGLVDVDISGEGWGVGSFAGQGYGDFYNVYSSGQIELTGSPSSSLGGLVGYGGDNISSSYSTADLIYAENAYGVGGLVGEGWSTNANIKDSYFAGQIISNGPGSSTVGGIVGGGYFKIDNSFSTANIEANSYAGGLVGDFYRPGWIKNSFNLGNIVADGDYIGGLTGSSGDVSISNSFNLGNLEGNENVGGLTGLTFTDTTIENSYNAGEVTGNANVGGLIAEDTNDPANAIDSFWDIDTSGQTLSDGGAGKTTSEMKDRSTFSAWDFDDVWGYVGFADVNDGYPFLNTSYESLGESVTNSAENIEHDSADLVGQFNANFHESTTAQYAFIYWKDSIDDAQITDLNSSTINPSLDSSVSISDLEPEQGYNFQFLTNFNGGITLGGVNTFTTGSVPTSTPTAPRPPTGGGGGVSAGSDTQDDSDEPDDFEEETVEEDVTEDTTEDDTSLQEDAFEEESDDQTIALEDQDSQEDELLEDDTDQDASEDDDLTEETDDLQEDETSEDEDVIEPEENGDDSQEDAFDQDSGAGVDSGSLLGQSLDSILSGFDTLALGTKETVDNFADTLSSLFATTAGDVASRALATAGLFSGIAVLTTSFASSMSLSEIFLLPFRLWTLFLTFVGLKKRHRPWGVVYDSITKQPLDPAYVVLKDRNGKQVAESITDLDGRYGFLVKPGTYFLEAGKTNYSFPSKKVSGRREDEMYSNLYLGQPIVIEEAGQVLAQNIPMDPENFDWNEFAKRDKKLMKFYSKWDRWLTRLADWFFGLGFVISVLSLFFVPEPYNLIIFGLYVFMLVLRIFGLKPKTYGRLTDKEGVPLSFAMIEVYLAGSGQKVQKKVADKNGRYYILIAKGNYYVVVSKKNDDESYTQVYKSPVMRVDEGIINSNMKI